MATVEQLAREAKSMSADDQLLLAETIMANLHSNPETEKKWIAEADARFQAYRRGEIETIDWATVQAALRG